MPRDCFRSDAPTLLAEADGNMWRVFCPFCERYHRHSPEPGHRTAHCDFGGNSLFLDTGYNIRKGPWARKGRVMSLSMRKPSDLP